MQDRFFSTLDEVTNANLATLDHLSKGEARGGEVALFKVHILANIGAYEMLPAAVRRHFNIQPYVGDYYALSDAWHAQSWTSIAAGLDAGLAAVAADPALQKEGGADLSDRPQSVGERIIAVCDQLEAVFDRGGSWETPLAQLSFAASSTPAQGDSDKLRKLMEKKRIPDYGAWRGEVIGAIWHARSIGHHQHHRKAR
jgi:hypothetical protein